jgi:hypothetical protein
MKTMRNLIVVAGLLAVLFASAAAVSTGAGEKPPTVAMKPDIVINDVKVDRTSSTATADNVRITVILLNANPSTNTGPFKVKMEWNDKPFAPFRELGSAGVPNLVNDPSMAAMSITRTFEHTVPKGKTFNYRATADFMNQVDEANESNNVEFEDYTAR